MKTELNAILVNECGGNIQELAESAIQGLIDGLHSQDETACFLMGTCFRNGYGTDKDLDTALYWFWHGTGFGTDDDIFWNMKVAEDYGDCLTHFYICRDEESWSRNSSDTAPSSDTRQGKQGCFEGMSKVENLDSKAGNCIAKFTEALSCGNPDAEFILGYCSWYGIGVPEDDGLAVKLLEDAAEKGNPDAQFYLARAYDIGCGVEQDKQTAFQWYMRAAEQGNSDATLLTGMCYEYGNGTDRDEEAAFQWYMKAACNRMGEYKIGLCYWNGIGVEEDHGSADVFFESAWRRGVEDAFEYQLEFDSELEEREKEDYDDEWDDDYE